MLLRAIVDELRCATRKNREVDDFASDDKTDQVLGYTHHLQIRCIQLLEADRRPPLLFITRISGFLR